MHSPARAPADLAAQRTSALLEDQPVSPREPAAIAAARDCAHRGWLGARQLHRVIAPVRPALDEALGMFSACSASSATRGSSSERSQFCPALSAWADDRLDLLLSNSP